MNKNYKIKCKIISICTVMFILISALNTSYASVIDEENSNTEEIQEESKTNEETIIEANNLTQTIEENSSKDEVTKENVESNTINALSLDDYNITIVSRDKDTCRGISGNTFSILAEDGSVLQENLITDEHGIIEITLEKGKYYLKQTAGVGDYSVNKALIEINVEGDEQINVDIAQTKPTTEEINNLNKVINVVEQNENTDEHNVTEVSNINITNLNRTVVNDENITNYDNVNNCVNTTNRTNTLNLSQWNLYRNYIQEEYTKNRNIQGADEILYMTRQDYINYIDMILQDSAKVPILPVASK